MTPHPPTRNPAPGEEGFALILLLVAIFIILLFLAVAAPKVAQDLRREKELEAVHRANEYVRAIQLYYRKFNSYPTTIDQLEKTNNIRFLRQRYPDPLTGKPDWRIIHVGENKTTVKGLFGTPLPGLPPGGMGGSSIGGTNTVSGSTPGSAPGAFGASPIGSSPGTSTPGPGGTSSTIGSSSGGTSTVDSGSGQSGSNFSGGGAIMGIGSSKTGPSILTLNEQTTYETWEFLYDPRIEQLRARSSIFGGGGVTAAPGAGSIGGSTPGSTPTGFGVSPGTTPGSTTPGSTTPGPTPTTPTTP
jgi:type II secretory pathway pseudopilin PulG